MYSTHSEEQAQALQAISDDHPETLTALLQQAGSAWDQEFLNELLRRSLCASEQCFHLLLENGTDINYIAYDGYTILHWAVSMEAQASADRIELLLRAGANPNARSERGNRHTGNFTPLHASVCYHDLGYVEDETLIMLLNYGADLNAEDDDGATPLHYIMYQCGSGIDLLCERGANPNARDHAGRTPLHILVGYGFAYQPLLRYIADVNAVDNDGNTPLHAAVIAENEADQGEFIPEVVGWLLSEGADPFIKNTAGQTALDIVLEYEDEMASNLLFEFFQCFFDRNDLATATKLLADERVVSNELFQRARLFGENHYAICVRSLTEGSQTTIQRSHPLHYAVIMSDLERIKALLDLKPELVNSRKYGVTPLHVAPLATVATLLIEHGADVNALGWLGRFATPLHTPRPDVVRVLLQHGADIHGGDHKATRLHFASRFNEMQVIELLLNAGAPVNAPDEQLRTPLHWAAAAESVMAAELLIERRASICARDKHGYTPRDLAAKFAGYDMQELLRLEAKHRDEECADEETDWDF